MKPQPGFREMLADVLNFPSVKFHPYLVTRLISARPSCWCPALPAALTLQAVLLPQPWPLSTRATGGTLRSLGGCIRIPRLSWRAWPRRLPAGLLLSPGPRNVTRGEHPHLPSPLLCGVTTSTGETAPAFEWNRTPRSRRRWPDVAVFTGRGIVRPPKRPALLFPPPCRWPTWKSHPSAVGRSRGRCRSAKSAAVGERQNLSQAMRLAMKGSGRGSGPAEAPQEQWQSFREPATEGRTKARAVPKLQLLPQHKTGGSKFGFFHLNPLRHCERGERARSLACRAPSLCHRCAQPGGPGHNLLRVYLTL